MIAVFPRALCMSWQLIISVWIDETHDYWTLDIKEHKHKETIHKQWTLASSWLRYTARLPFHHLWMTKVIFQGHLIPLMDKTHYLLWMTIICYESHPLWPHSGLRMCIDCAWCLSKCFHGKVISLHFKHKLKKKMVLFFPTGMGILMLIGCPMKDFAGLQTASSG